jgi:hypothetical protein
MKNSKNASPVEFPEEQADITDKNILQTRIVLGCVFALTFGLPLSFYSLEGLRHFLFPYMAPAVATSVTVNLSSAGTPTGTASSAPTATSADIIWIVAPFMLGFSIHLVISLLNRFIASMRTFFGVTAR